MAQQVNRSRRCNPPSSEKICDPMFHPHCLLDLQIIRKTKRGIGAMKFIPTGISFLFSFTVSSSLFLLCQKPTSMNLSSAALSFWPLRLILTAMYYFLSGLSLCRSVNPVKQRSSRRSHCSKPAPCLLKITTDSAISQTRSLTVLCIHCVVKTPLYCQIPMVSAAHKLTLTLAFTAQTWTCRVGIWIVFASGTTDFGNQKTWHDISGSQWWSRIAW